MCFTFPTASVYKLKAKDNVTQQPFICSNSAIEKLEKSVNYVQNSDVDLVSLMLTLTIFHTFF